MKDIPIAVQLYSVHEDCAQDLPGTLGRIARMGYAGVEFAGFHGYSAQELRKILDDLGLEVAGSHVPIPTLLADDLPATVEFNRTLGNKYLIVPGLPPEYQGSAEAWRRAAETLDGIAERLTEHGMWTGYHNHFHEFKPVEGIVPFDYLFAHTREAVCLQADTGNAMAGGADVIPYIKRYKGRSRTVHVKEHSNTNEKPLIGEGDVNWQELFAVCESVGGTEWYIVEEEKHPVPPMESIARSLENLVMIRGQT